MGEPGQGDGDGAMSPTCGLWQHATVCVVAGREPLLAVLAFSLKNSVMREGSAMLTSGSPCIVFMPGPVPLDKVLCDGLTSGAALAAIKQPLNSEKNITILQNYRRGGWTGPSL